MAWFFRPLQQPNLMAMKKLVLLTGIFAIALLTSCSSLHVEKRHYRNGFYVNLNHNNKPTADVKEQAEKPAETALPVTSETEEIVPVEVAPSVTATDKSVAAIPQTQEKKSSPAELPAQSLSTDKVSAPQTETKTSEDPANAPADDVELILLVILALLLPPLAVFLVEGVSKWFWITLILCIFGGGVFLYPVIGGLWLVAMIIALFVVFGLI